MIELAVLGLLKEGSLHGYELKKRLRDVVGSRAAVSFGSLYPALSRLERDGAVAAVAGERAVVAPDMPMTGSFDGEAAAFRASRRVAGRGPRNKKVYGITPAGEARLAQLIADPADDERSFPVKVAFCRFTDPATRIGLLERRRAALVERLGEAHSTIRARGDRLDRYRRSLLEHHTETTERDIAWLDRLLDGERSLPEGDGGRAAPATAASPAPTPPTTRTAATAAAAAAAPSFPTSPHAPAGDTAGTDTAFPATGGSR